MKQKQLEHDNASDICNKPFNFNTESFQITKNLKRMINTMLNIYFLKDATLINALIFKMIKNQMMINR